MKKFALVLSMLLMGAMFVVASPWPPGSAEKNATHQYLQPQAEVIVMVGVQSVYDYSIMANASFESSSLLGIAKFDRQKHFDFAQCDKYNLVPYRLMMPIARNAVTNEQGNFSLTNLQPYARQLTCYTLMPLTSNDKNLLHSCPTIRYL